MAGFEENDLYEAFGLEQPKEGGNDPEPAEPGAEVQEQGEEPGADSAHEPPEGQELSQEQEEPEDQDGGGAGEQEEPPEDGGGKPAQQTKEQRAENARRRRQEEQEAAIKAAVEKALAEEREKSKADMARLLCQGQPEKHRHREAHHHHGGVRRPGGRTMTPPSWRRT